MYCLTRSFLSEGYVYKGSLDFLDFPAAKGSLRMGGRLESIFFCCSCLPIEGRLLLNGFYVGAIGAGFDTGAGFGLLKMGLGIGFSSSSSSKRLGLAYEGLVGAGCEVMFDTRSGGFTDYLCWI
jgi:hypothetical protein